MTDYTNVGGQRMRDLGELFPPAPVSDVTLEGLKEDSKYSLLLLLLSHISRGRLCATPETAVHQASPSLGFSRQEHWSGLPFPSPMHESEK